jgi:TPR repeat protein
MELIAKNSELELLEKAKNGDVDAEHALGLMYLKGEGVAQDIPKAAGLYEKAAGHGHPGAQVVLGTMYVHGDSVAQDTPKGLGLLEKAAEQGSAEAQNELGSIYLRGDCVVQDKPKGKGFLEKAAGQVHTEALYSLGTMYLSGDGVAQDTQKAAALYEKAAGHGHAGAQYTFDFILESQAQKLMRAAQTGDIKTLEREESWIRSRKARLDLDSSGVTILHVAAEYGMLSVVEWIVAKGVMDLEAATEDGTTVLHVAAQWGHTAVAECFLANGANVDSRDALEQTPLMLAACSQHHVAVMEILVANGADVAASNSEGGTVMHMVQHALYTLYPYSIHYTRTSSITCRYSMHYTHYHYALYTLSLCTTHTILIHLRPPAGGLTLTIHHTPCTHTPYTVHSAGGWTTSRAKPCDDYMASKTAG